MSKIPLTLTRLDQFALASSRQDYETPDEFIIAVLDKLGIVGFYWDLAASKENSRGEIGFFSEKQNSLIQCWWDKPGWQWLNPPYADIRPWVEKAADAKERGANIAVLVPASVGANWWAQHVHGHATVLFLNGRISFDGKHPYPKDCALLIYSNSTKWRVSEDYWSYHIWTWRKG